MYLAYWQKECIITNKLEYKIGLIIQRLKGRRVYFIRETPGGSRELCKILNRYDNAKDANKDLIDLLTNKTNESAILKKYKN